MSPTKFSGKKTQYMYIYLRILNDTCMLWNIKNKEHYDIIIYEF